MPKFKIKTKLLKMGLPKTYIVQKCYKEANIFPQTMYPILKSEEKGELVNIQLSTALAICNCFGKEVQELFKLVKEKK